MSRYRIVTRTVTAGGNETHVSSVILTHAEAWGDVVIEARLADAAGWHTVTRGDGLAVELVCTRGRTNRTLTIRQSDPFDDTI